MEQTIHAPPVPSTFTGTTARLRAGWDYLAWVNPGVDPLRYQLNRALAGILTILNVLAVPALSFYPVSDPTVRALLWGVFAAFGAGWLLNRRGSSWGAVCVTVVMLIGVSLFVDPYTAAAAPNQLALLPVEMMLPIITAALFLSGRAAWCVVLAMAGMLAFRVTGVYPVPIVAMTFIIGAIKLSLVTVVVTAGAQVFHRAVTELAAGNALLEHRVAVRTAELSESIAEKQRIMRARQDAMVDAAHDIKGAMQGVTAGVEFAQMGLEAAGLDLPETVEDLRGAAAAARRVLAMTNDLRDAALLEQQALPLRRETHDLVALALEQSGHVRPGLPPARLRPHHRSDGCCPLLV